MEKAVFQEQCELSKFNEYNEDLKNAKEFYQQQQQQQRNVNNNNNNNAQQNYNIITGHNNNNNNNNNNIPEIPSYSKFEHNPQHPDADWSGLVDVTKKPRKQFPHDLSTRKVHLTNDEKYGMIPSDDADQYRLFDVKRKDECQREKQYGNKTFSNFGGPVPQNDIHRHIDEISHYMTTNQMQMAGLSTDPEHMTQRRKSFEMGIAQGKRRTSIPVFEQTPYERKCSVREQQQEYNREQQQQLQQQLLDGNNNQNNNNIMGYKSPFSRSSNFSILGDIGKQLVANQPETFKKMPHERSSCTQSYQNRTTKLMINENYQSEGNIPGYTGRHRK